MKYTYTPYDECVASWIRKNFSFMFPRRTDLQDKPTLRRWWESSSPMDATSEYELPKLPHYPRRPRSIWGTFFK